MNGSGYHQISPLATPMHEIAGISLSYLHLWVETRLGNFWKNTRFIVPKFNPGISCLPYSQWSRCWHHEISPPGSAPGAHSWHLTILMSCVRGLLSKKYLEKLLTLMGPIIMCGNHAPIYSMDRVFAIECVQYLFNRLHPWWCVILTMLLKLYLSAAYWGPNKFTVRSRRSRRRSRRRGADPVGVCTYAGAVALRCRARELPAHFERQIQWFHLAVLSSSIGLLYAWAVYEYTKVSSFTLLFYHLFSLLYLFNWLTVSLCS